MQLNIAFITVIMFAEVLVVALSFLTIFFLEGITQSKSPVFNVYRQKDIFYYVKFPFMFLILHLQKLSKGKNKRLIANKHYSELEKPQVLPSNKRVSTIFLFYYFNGDNVFDLI